MPLISPLLHRRIIKIATVLLIPGILFAFQSMHLGLNVLVVGYIHLSLLFGSWAALVLLGASRHKARILIAFSWLLSLGLIWTLTPRVLLYKINLQVENLHNLDISLWTSTRGQILLVYDWFPELSVKKLDVPELNSNGSAVTPEKLIEMLEASTGRRARLSYRFGYCDMGFRTISVLVRLIEPEG